MKFNEKLTVEWNKTYYYKNARLTVEPVPFHVPGTFSERSRNVPGTEPVPFHGGEIRISIQLDLMLIRRLKDWILMGVI